MIKTIIFDWKRTLYDPDKKELIPGAKKLLTFLKPKEIPLILIGKGKEEMLFELERLKIKDFFTKVIFEKEKNIDLYLPFIDKINPQNTILIGDRARTEIETGIKLGTTTIWLRRGKYKDEKPFSQPSITVTTLHKLIDALKELFYRFS